MPLQQLFEDLQDNLSLKCCGRFILSAIPKNARYIKLYGMGNLNIHKGSSEADHLK